MSFVLKLPSQLKKGAAEQEHAVKKEQGLVFDVVDPNAHLAWNRNKGGPVWGKKNAPQGGEVAASEGAKAGPARPKGWNVQPPTGAAFSIAEGLAKLEEAAHPHNPPGPPKAPLAGRFSGGGGLVHPPPVEHPVTAETYKDPVFEGAAWADEVEEEDELPTLDIPIPPGPAALTASVVPKAKDPEPRPRPDAWGVRRPEADEERGQQVPLGGSSGGMEQRTRSADLMDRRAVEADRGFDRPPFGDRRGFGPGAGHEGGGRLGGDGGFTGVDRSRGYGEPRVFPDRGLGYDRDRPRHDDRGLDGPAGARGAGGVQSPGAYDRGVTLLARPTVHANPAEQGALEGPQRFRSTSLPEAPKDVPRAERPEREMRTEDRNPAHPDARTPPRSPAMQPVPEGWGRAEPADDVSAWAALGKERTRAALEPAKPVVIMKRPDAPASPSLEDRRRGAAEALAKVKAHVADQPPPPVHHEPRPRPEPEQHHAHHHAAPHAHGYHAPQSNFTPLQLDAQRAEEKRRFREEAIARLKAQAEAAQPKPPPTVHAAPPPHLAPEAPKGRLDTAAKAVVHPVQPQLHVTPQIMRRAPQPEPAPVASDDGGAAGKCKLNRRSNEGAADEVTASPKVHGSTAKGEEEAGAGDAAQGKGKKGKVSKEAVAKQQQQQQQQQAAKTPREGKAPKGKQQQQQALAKPADAVQAQAPPSKKDQQQQAPKQGQEEGASTQTPRGSKANKGPKPSKENSDTSGAPSAADKAPKDKEAKVFKGNNAPRGQKKADGVKAPRARNDAGEAPAPTQMEDSNNAAKAEEGAHAPKVDKSARAPVQIYRPPVRSSGKPEGGGGKKGEADGSPKAEGEGGSGRGGRGGGRGRGRGRGGGGKAGEGVSGAPQAQVPAAQ